MQVFPTKQGRYHTITPQFPQALLGGLEKCKSGKVPEGSLYTIPAHPRHSRAGGNPQNQTRKRPHNCCRRLLADVRRIHLLQLRSIRHFPLPNPDAVAQLQRLGGSIVTFGGSA